MENITVNIEGSKGIFTVISFRSALELNSKRDVEIFVLHDDGSESLVTSNRCLMEARKYKEEIGVETSALFKVPNLHIIKSILYFDKGDIWDSKANGKLTFDSIDCMYAHWKNNKGDTIIGHYGSYYYKKGLWYNF